MHTEAAPATPLLDLQYVRSILRSQADARHMLSMIAATLGDQVNQVTSSLNAGDVRAAQAVLHQLKGFLPVFCAASLAEELVAVEQLSRTASAREVKQRFSAVKPLLLQFDREIQAWMAQTSPNGNGSSG